MLPFHGYTKVAPCSTSDKLKPCDYLGIRNYQGTEDSAKVFSITGTRL